MGNQGSCKGLRPVVTVGLEPTGSIHNRLSALASLDAIFKMKLEICSIAVNHLSISFLSSEETYKIAYKQAEKDFENAQKQVTALEEEVVKALTGESQLDLSIANQMLLKHRGKLEAAQKAMDDAKAKLEAEQETARETKAEVDELLSWADCYEAADISTKHVIVARLIERIDISSGYKVHIKFRISLKQFLDQA